MLIHRGAPQGPLLETPWNPRQAFSHSLGRGWAHVVRTLGTCSGEPGAEFEAIRSGHDGRWLRSPAIFGQGVPIGMGQADLRLPLRTLRPALGGCADRGSMLLCD